MKVLNNLTALTRVTAVTVAVVAVVGGVTFASLQSQQAILKGNTIQTAMASLQLSSDGTTYSNSLSGYAFMSIIPGGQPTPTSGYPVYLKNAGTTALSLKFSVAKVTNTDGVDLAKVHVILSPLGGGVPLNFTLQDLLSSSTTGGVALTNASRLIPSQVVSYGIQVSMEGDAFNGASASLSDIDFSFGATAIN